MNLLLVAEPSTEAWDELQQFDFLEFESFEFGDFSEFGSLEFGAGKRVSKVWKFGNTSSLEVSELGSLEDFAEFGSLEFGSLEFRSLGV